MGLRELVQPNNKRGKEKNLGMRGENAGPGARSRWATGKRFPNRDGEEYKLGKRETTGGGEGECSEKGVSIGSRKGVVSGRKRVVGRNPRGMKRKKNRHRISWGGKPHLAREDRRKSAEI